MADIIQNKMNQVMGDLARPTKFKCQIFPPKEIKCELSILNEGDSATSSTSEISQYLDYFCHATSFPGLTVETIDFKYRGRTLPVKSVQTYQQKWTATFYNDEKHAVRKLFLDWMTYDQAYQFEDKTKGNFEGILPSISIYQLDFEMSKDCVVYTMMNVFPTNVGEVSVQYDGLNQIETFTVEFAYTHFEINTISGEGLTSSEVTSLIKNTIQNTINSVTNTLKDAVFGALDDLVSPVLHSVSDSFENFISTK